MKTFEDLLKLGMTEPAVHGYLILWRRGEISKEEALIGMVMTLAEQKKDVTDNYINHMQRCETPSIRM